MVGMTRAVGRVQIDHHVRIEIVEQPDHRSCLWRVELHVVAVDVEALGIGTRALPADRSVLQTTARQRHALVAIGVVDGVDEEHHRSQPVGVRPASDVAHQRQHRFFSFHLASMDVGLQIHA